MEIQSDLKIISIVFRKAYLNFMSLQAYFNLFREAYFNHISTQSYFNRISRSVFQLYFAYSIYLLGISL